MPRFTWVSWALLLAISSCQAETKSVGDLVYTEEREPCSDRNPWRNLYFGDLHVHSELSFDAWSYGTRATPEQAYGFARGAAVRLAPLDQNGVGTREAQLERPLDFGALSDHQEFLGEVRSCVDPDQSGYQTPTCEGYREGEVGNVVLWGLKLAEVGPVRFEDICDPVPACTELAALVWQEIQQAAQVAYDRTSTCEFTSFVAYEYSNSESATNFHRNVIFRNANVPALPPSTFETPDPWNLLRSLKSECLDAGIGCDLISIPHNSNWSNGQLFDPSYPGADGPFERLEMAELRASLEPLVEVVQHKGSMECDPNFLEEGVTDELCDFEKQRQLPFDDCGDYPGNGGMRLLGCVSRYDFIRNVLKTGILHDSQMGVNPFPLGMIGSTDTHNGTFGWVKERDFEGQVGTTDDTAEKRLSDGNITHHGVRFNPGGLAAVWALENSRDALFEAFRRREVYGTSGPRMRVRFFGGRDLPDLCDDPERARKGYKLGVPMGAVLSQTSGAKAPGFAVWAQADSPGAPLQRIQIIKGWVDNDGITHERIFEIAGEASAGPGVDLETCQVLEDGHPELCAHWTDPGFDPDQHAFYYARVLEVPTCRWSVYQCNALAPEERPQNCSDPLYYRAIQERAWTSPIWYRPPEP